MSNNARPDHRQAMRQWERTAITEEDAARRGLVQLSERVYWRNLTVKVGLARFALSASESRPVLVLLNGGRQAALFYKQPENIRVARRRTDSATQDLLARIRARRQAEHA